MGGGRLELSGVSFRHKMSDPRRFRPWKTRPGPGIHDISFTLPAGSIIGLIGANGAGKTTLMNVLCGLVMPESGTIKLDEEIIASKGMKAKGHSQIGFMPEQVTWPGPGTPRQSLEWLSAMRDEENDLDSIFKLVGLSSRSDSQLESMSGGMRQRLSLASALLGNPKILILDEPLNGLDPVAQVAFQGLLRQLADKGHTILISSHMLAELDRFVDRIIVLHKGQLIGQGTINDVESNLRLAKKMIFKGFGDSPTNIIESSGLQIVEENEGNGKWSITVNLESNFSPKQVSELVSKLSKSGHAPCEVSTLSYDLATILSAATGLTPSEVGMGVDEHFVVPLAKIGGEEE